jgi:hypothetical protein
MPGSGARAKADACGLLCKGMASLFGMHAESDVQTAG